jgi:hypothetical protein
VYDVDNIVDPSIIEDLMAAKDVPGIHGVPYTCFGPDTLAEARNRGYRLWKGQRGRAVGDVGATDAAVA